MPGLWQIWVSPLSPGHWPDTQRYLWTPFLLWSLFSLFLRSKNARASLFHIALSVGPAQSSDLRCGVDGGSDLDGAMGRGGWGWLKLIGWKGERKFINILGIVERI